MSFEDALVEQLADRVAAKVLEAIRQREQPRDATIDEWMTMEEAAQLTKLSVRWLVEHADQLPFVVRVNRKILRVRRKALERWMQNRP